MQDFIGKKDTLFSFMRENDIPVYHLSNIFFRDIEYAIRDYVRAHEGKDIGGKLAGHLATAFVADLEKQSVLQPHGNNTWILKDEKFSLKSAKEEDGAQDAAVAEAAAESA